MQRLMERSTDQTGKMMEEMCVEPVMESRMGVQTDGSQNSLLYTLEECMETSLSLMYQHQTTKPGETGVS